MTYDALEESRTQGQPISLYFIRYGEPEDAYYAYTSAEQQVVYTFDSDLGPVAFQPIAITRGEINASGALDRAELEVRVPLSAGINAVFAGFPPSQVVAMFIFDGHFGEPEFKTVWMGRLTAQAFEDEEAVYTCEPASTSLKRVGLQRFWQRGCPLVLYSQGWKKCNANEAAATTSVLTTAIDGAIVSIPDDWVEGFRKPLHIGGMAKWSTPDGRLVIRTIVGIPAADQVQLNAPATGLGVGVTVHLSLGCPHDRDGCALIHDNIHNYGGQDWIPTKNPVGVVRNFG